jgi:hypothetical protein
MEFRHLQSLYNKIHVTELIQVGSFRGFYGKLFSAKNKKPAEAGL